MTTTAKLAGVWSAVLTPVDHDFEPDAPRAVAYYRDLLRDGIDGINLLGTTGEAMSFSVGQRVRLMEAIAREEGIPGNRRICGTGANALSDTIALTRACGELGFAAALVMPPHFFRDASDDGILHFYDALLAGVGANPPPIFLYNFPKMSGITFHPDLVDRLMSALPGAIAGVKDSSNDATLQAEIIARHPELRVFPGSEANLVEAKRYGAAGCISGSVCLWPTLAQEVYATEDPDAAERLRAERNALTGAPLIALVRSRLAEQSGDEAWARSMPPNN